MKTINVNENYKIKFDGVQYMPHYFIAGGDIVKGVGGKEVETKDKWISSGQYLNTLTSAVKWIVDHMMTQGEDVTIAEYVNQYREAVELITEKVGQ